MKARMAACLAQPSVQRTLVAGPLTILASLAVLAGMPHWIPAGAGRIDNLVFPVMAFPLIWSAIFLYACLAEEAVGVARVLGLVISANAAIIALSLLLRE